MHETLLLAFQSKASVDDSSCDFFVVHTISGLNYVQDLGMGETSNVLDKPSVEHYNKIRVAGEPFMHILNGTGREGVYCLNNQPIVTYLRH